MNSASARYQSFSRSGGWPHPNSFLANPLRLAQCGFFFQPVAAAPDRVACFCCGTAVARWKPRSDPRTEHLRYNPNCPFINGNYNNFRYEAVRLESFTTASPPWPLAPDFQAQPWRLAKAGFHYVPRPPAGLDRCECFCCGIALVRWEKGDDPWREHQKNSPACAFVRGLPTDNIIMPATSESPAPERKSEMEELMEEIESLGIPYDTDIPNSFLCPITQDIIRNPIVLEDGHTYEKSAIYQWLTSHNTSPLTNKPLVSKLLFPNHALKTQLVEYAQGLLKKHKTPHQPDADVPSAPPYSSSNHAGSSPQLSDALIPSSSQLPPEASKLLSFAAALPNSASGQEWMQPILIAVQELVTQFRQLLLAKESPAPPQPSEPDADAPTTEATEEKKEDDPLHQQYQLAESRIQYLIDEVVAEHLKERVQAYLHEQLELAQAEVKQQLAKAADQAVVIIQEAEKTAERVLKEKSDELADSHAALIASIEQLSRQRSELQLHIDRLNTQVASTPSAPPLEQPAAVPSSSSSSSSSSPALPSDTPSAAPATPPASSEPQPQKKKSFASFFGFS